MGVTGLGSEKIPSPWSCVCLPGEEALPLMEQGRQVGHLLSHLGPPELRNELAAHLVLGEENPTRHKDCPKIHT